MKTYPAGKLPPAELSRLLSAYTHRHERLLVPPTVGEDAAVIDCGDRLLVAKTDPITFASDEIGWYAVHVNANDIAAMGATPRFFLSTILLPEERATPELAESIFRSIHQAAEDLDIAVCGGHTEVTYGLDRPLVIGQMLGETTRDRLVRSSGLRPGHALLLTKGLGIEATAIIAREKRAQLRDRRLYARLFGLLRRLPPYPRHQRRARCPSRRPSRTSLRHARPDRRRGRHGPVGIGHRIRCGCRNRLPCAAYRSGHNASLLNL